MRQIIYILVIITLCLNTVSAQERKTDTNLEVGTLPGSFGVSPSGAATYTIPIDLPEGRAGLTPQLALVYNSQQGNSIMGKGWSLSGFSSISRTNPTYYHDGEIDKVDFENDALMLDGMRLIEVESSTNETIYRTEIDQISKIIYHKTGANGDYFEVLTKSGITKEYGNTEDSRQYYSTAKGKSKTPLIWHLNRVIQTGYDNVNSNREFYLMNYSYYNDRGIGECHPLKIQYIAIYSKGATRNEDYTVSFGYGSMPAVNQRTQYFQKGTENNAEKYIVKNSKKLNYISVVYSTQQALLKRYNLVYTPNQSLIKDYFLKSVQLESTDPEGNPLKALNKTEFNWKFYNTNYTKSNIAGPTPSQIGVATPTMVKLAPIDINGDGKDEIAEFKVTFNEPERYYNIHLQFSSQEEIIIPNQQGVISLAGADFDNDGLDELLVGFYNYFRIFRFVKNGNDWEVSSDVYQNNQVSENHPEPFAADMNGDGLTDCIVSNDEGAKLFIGSGNISDIFTNDSDGNVPSIIYSADYELASIKDFNGDGKTDVLLKHNPDDEHDLKMQLHIYDKSESTGFKYLSSFIPSSTIDNAQLYFEDFNGDGKTDLLRMKYMENDNRMLHEFYPSFGFSFVNEPEVKYSFEFGSHYPVALDMNNDQRADLVLSEGIGGNKVRIQVGYIQQDGYNFNFEKIGEYELMDPKIFEESNTQTLTKTYADMNGNGIYGPVYEIRFTPDGSQKPPTEVELYLVALEETTSYASDLITSITNGFGVTAKIAYQGFTTSLVSYSKTNEYPLCRLKAKMPLVKEQWIDYSGVKLNYLTYSFSDPVYHKRGKGFLGFMQTSVGNYQNNIRTTTEYSIFDPNGKYYHPYAKKTEQQMIDNNSIKLLVSENELEVINTITGNNIIYTPVVTMSIVHTRDLDGSYINTSKSIIDTRYVDIYGNIEKTISLVSPKDLDKDASESAYEFRTLSETVYTSPDITNWLVGRPDNVKISQQYQGDIKDNIIQKKFTYYKKSNIGWPKLENVKTTPNNNLSLSTTIKYVYDKYGNTISETISAPNANPPVLSKTTSFEYSHDFDGRFLTKKTNTVNGVEYITTFDYYSNHGLLKSKTANPEDNPLTTEFEYDSFGKIKLANNPDGGQTITQFSWNESGKMNNNLDDFYSKISKKVDALFVHTMYNKSAGGHIMDAKFTYFDKFEREIATVVFDQKNRAISTLTEYDPNGRVYSQSETHFDQTSPSNFTTYRYDKLGRVIAVNTPTAGIITVYNGRSQTVINEYTRVRKTKIVNAIGQTISVEDPTGTIFYEYYSSGNTKSINALGAITTMKYDDAGNQTELNDPNAGTITYNYNAFGQLFLQTDASGNATSMSYDNIGRLSLKSILNRGKDIPDETYYYYQDNPKVNGFGQLANIIGANGISYTYTYDQLSRLVEEKETINNTTYSHKYTYHTYLNKIKTLEYPSEFKIKYNYKDNGYLENITEMDGHMLWQPLDNNGHGQLTDYTLGNNLSTHKGFDDFGFPEEIITSNVQDLAYRFDPTTGNLMERTDNSLGYEISETFGYDIRLLNNRLTNWQVQGQQSYEINYEQNGNIFTKSDVTMDGDPLSVFQYGNSAGLHAITEIFNARPDYLEEASNTQTVIYNGFNKIKSISQETNDKDKNNIYKLDFTYGPDNARKQTLLYKNNVLQKEKLFIGGNYEVEIDASGIERKLHYIMGGDGLFAIYEIKGKGNKMYYVHKDYLGSIETITDYVGKTVEKLSFDPWGRKRNPLNWTYEESPYPSLFDRGYTTHEHLAVFGIINMNGRLYDPWLGRMLSPDPYVQAPSSLQNYNRYSYAMNNPLKYTDPSGEFAQFIIGAIIGAYMNVVLNRDRIDNFGQMMLYAGIGAVVGAATAGVGVAVAGGIGFGVAGGVSGFAGGAIIGGASGITSGFLSGVGNTFVDRGNIGQAFENGLKQGAIQGVTGAMFGGIVGGLSATNNGKTFWTGTAKDTAPTTTWLSDNSSKNLIASTENAVQGPPPNKPSQNLIEEKLKLMSMAERGRHANGDWRKLNFDFNVGITPEKNALGLTEPWEYNNVSLFAGKENVSAHFSFLPGSNPANNYVTKVHIGGFTTNRGFNSGYQIYLQNRTGWDIGIINFGSDETAFNTFVNFLLYN